MRISAYVVLQFFILTTIFVADPLLAIGLQNSSAGVSQARNYEADKIHVTTKALVHLSPKRLAIWQGKSLIEITALHSDDQGMFVYTNELGECLASASFSRLRDMAGSGRQISRSKGFSRRPPWKCEMCPRAFWTRDDLYDHIYKEHGAHAYDRESTYDD